MNHLGDTNKMVSDTPSVCPFCGSYVATLDDGKSCGDSEGNWVAFRCLTSWHRGYHDPRKLQSKTCETVERHKLYDRIKRLEAVVNDPHALWTNWLRGDVKLPAGIGDVRQYQDRIKRLEEAGDAMASILNNTRKDWYTSDQCEVTAFTWNEAKEAKP